MLLFILSSLASPLLLLPYNANAATLPVGPDDFPVSDQGAPHGGHTSPQTNLEWEQVKVPSPGPTNSLYQVACNSRLGAGLEVRSCFDALHAAPRGDQQEVWANSVPPGVHVDVILPEVTLSSTYRYRPLSPFPHP